MLYDLHYSNKYNFLPLLPKLLGVNHLQEPVQRPHGFPVFQWFYCVKGQGEFIINGQRSIISKGQGLLIYPHISHSYKGLTSDWTVHLIGFGGNACTEILQTLHMLESGVYHFSNSDIFPTHIENLLYLSQRDITEKETELSKACYSMLLDLSPSIRQIHNTTATYENELVRKLIDYMEEKYACDISLNELTDYVNLSKEYMCNLFKHTMHQTIMQYLQTVRISRARIFLIQYPEKHVAEIAHMCGFESPSYFGKVFKKIAGCTPDNFRR